MALSARPVRAILTVDRLILMALGQALLTSPLTLAGLCGLILVVVIRVADLIGGATTAPVLAGVGVLAAATIVTFCAPDGVSGRLGPFGFALMNPTTAAKVGLARTSGLLGPVLICAVSLVLFKGGIALTQLPWLFAGVIGGMAGTLAVMRAAPLLASLPPWKRKGWRAPAANAFAMGLLLGGALLLGAWRLQGQDAPQASAFAIAAVAVAALASTRVDGVKFSLLAACPASLTALIAPLTMRPFIVTALFVLAAGSPAGLSSGAALVAAALAGSAAATVRVLLALTALGRRPAVQPRAMGMELLLIALTGATGMAVLAPAWAGFRLVWLWRRAQRVRWFEASA